MMISGVYQILNKINGKGYIGSAANIQQRRCKHLSYLRQGNHDNLHLQRAWNKYGAEAFEFSVLELCEKRLLTLVEQIYINRFGMENLYNICPVAGSSLGLKLGPHSEKTKERLRQANLGKHLSEKTKKKISQAHLGKQLSEKTKRKMSKSAKGRHHSKETKKKISQALVGNTNAYKSIKI
jgi:group I intron endonuclease